ncbi:S1 RNA-binding domain-containing protein [Candidatus Leptofilum sp.]|uniref:S1 RNA-binding domain-containing protein n=1 Tax=Candidatus Leptofilum sp. TaxID=3241576 RepID=UPI003B5BFF09
MNKGLTKSSPKNKQPITATVENLFSYGVFVLLDDGRKGYIRRREMSWDGDIDPRKLLKPFQKIKAIVLEDAKGNGRVELSYKQTLPDPWQAFIATFRQGMLISGVVKDIHPSGIFVRVWEGVDGFVPNQQLATWHVACPGETFWIGDHIEALISRLDRKNKKVRLSIRSRLAQQAMVSSVVKQIGEDEVGDASLSVLAEEDDSEERLNHRISDELRERIGMILVLEDQDDLREPLVKWLCDRGFHALGAGDTTTAVQLIKKQYFDVCLVDLDLPDVDGIAFVKQLRQAKHESHVIFMSGSDWLNKRSAEIEKLEVSAALFKPLDFAEIDGILHKIGLGETLLPLQAPKPTKQVGRRSFQKLAQIMQNHVSLRQRLQKGLEHIVDLTKAEDGIIFYQSAASQSISVIAQAGQTVLNGDALFSLDDSPVENVLQDEELVFETKVTKSAYFRFRKLLQLLSFESCIGVPMGRELSSNYALFLFHQEPQAFHQYRLYDAQSTAALLTVALENELFEERVQGISTILLSGQLATGFGHEVNNKLTALEAQLRNLKLACLQIERGANSTNWEGALTQAKRTQDGILGTVEDLKKTVRLFQNLAKEAHSPTFDTNQVIRQAYALLRPVLSKEKTMLTLNIETELPLVAGSSIRLQQAVLNILLNGLQQMLPLEVKERRLEVVTKMTDMNAPRPIKISLIDTGIGIHRQLWEKIFTMGFSTREDGTGLGLYIARSLVESLGGRIYVEQSLILIGTTFVIELPGEEAFA